MMTDCTVLNKLLEANEVELMTHLEAIDAEMYLNNCIYRWFLSLFIHNTHELLWQEIWDIFMLEGNIVLFKASIAILKLALKDILQAKTFGEVQNIFLNKLQSKNDVKYLLYYLLIKRFNFNINTINKNRAKIMPKVIEGMRGNKDFLTKKAENRKECDLNWPLCTHDDNYKFEISQYFIYKQLERPLLINDYCCINTNREEMKNNYHLINQNGKNANDINAKRVFNQIVIERRKHSCQNNTNTKDNIHSNHIKPKRRNTSNDMPYSENEERDEKEMTKLMKTLTLSKPV